MYRAQYDVGLRNTAQDHAFLRLPSRVLMTLLSLLFLVSVQLCYAMAHDAPYVPVVSDVGAVGPHHMVGTGPSSDVGKTAPMDHGVKIPNACIMMTCGCVFQLGADLRSFAPAQDFGLPPLVAALSGKSPKGDLRPPISLQA